MKKLIGILIGFVILFGSFAVAQGQSLIDMRQQQLLKEVKQLEVQEKRVSAGKRAALRKRINVLNAQIAQLTKEIAADRATYAPPPVAVAPSQIKPVRVEAVKERRELALKKSRGTEIGLSAGLIASIPGVKLEFQSNFPYGELKYGLAYAQGEDSNKVNRKHALVFFDVSRRFAPANYQGIRPYWSVGINYDAYTSTRVSGALGWQCALGMEGDITDSSFYFLDLGYGVINTGFSPIYNGLSAQLGYRALL